MDEEAQGLGVHLTPEQVDEVTRMLLHATSVTSQMGLVMMVNGLLGQIPQDEMKEMERSLYAVTKIFQPDVYKRAKAQRNSIIRAMGREPTDV